MDRDLTSPIGDDRAAAVRALESAQRNRVLSGEQACAVAQVHALLAIERRLANLCAVFAVDRSDHLADGVPLATLS